MPFSGLGSGTIGDPFQITSLTQYNEIDEEPTGSHYVFMNDIDASGQIVKALVGNNYIVDGNGHKFLNIETIERFGTPQKQLFEGTFKNIELNFNWSADFPDEVAPAGNFAILDQVKISGSISNTNASGSVAGVADRIFDATKDILVTAYLSAHVKVSAFSSSVASSSTSKNMLFVGAMTDLSGSAILDGGVSSDLEDNGSSYFWDKDVAQTEFTEDQISGGKTTVQLQTLSTYTNVYSETYAGTCVVDGTTVSVYPGIGNPDFNFSVGDTVYIHGVAFEVASIIDSKTITVTSAPKSSIRTITGDEFGTGDGSTTSFSVSENALQPGTITIYEDGVATTAYSITEANGNLSFDTAPANGVVLTADYDYSLQYVISQGTGTYKLQEAFDIADKSSASGNEIWVIDDGNAYPELQVLIPPPAIEGTILYDSGPNAGNPVNGARVIYMYADNEDLENLTILEEVVTGANGTHALTETIPPGKVPVWTAHFRDESAGKYFTLPIRIANSYASS